MVASINDIAERLGLARREVSRLLDAAEACSARIDALLADSGGSLEAEAARATELQALLNEQDLRLAAVDAAVEHRDKLQAALDELRKPRSS